MYNVYVLDYDGTSIELDTEEIEFGLDLKISYLNDLSLRSGNRTKEVTLKGTAKNNEAFGHIYRWGRTNDISYINKLFFNYNSLRTVDCLIYHDGYLLFRGTLRLIEVVRTKGVFYYKVVITDAVIDLMKVTQDALLEEIDLTHLTHRYFIDTITQSWSQQTQRWNGTTFSYTPYQKGSGYYYGYIFYGTTASGVATFSNINVLNYRPQIYVREIFDRIITVGVTGYSWELRAGSGVTNRFNSLVVPDNREKMSTRVGGFQETAYMCGSQSGLSSWYIPSQNHFNDGVYHDGRVDRFHTWRMAKMSCKSATGSSNISLLSLNNAPNNAWRDTQYCLWNISTDINCEAEWGVTFTYSTSNRVQLTFDLVERDYSADPSGRNEEGWSSVSSWPGNTQFNTLSGTGSITFVRSVPKRDYLTAKQYAIRLYTFSDYAWNPTHWGHGDIYVSSSYLKLPQNANSSNIVNVPYNTIIKPQLPENVKQYEFMKSIMLMFNLYAYVEKERPKHIIFQTRDDFYAYCNADNLVGSAIDWSNKIVYDNDWTKSFNVTIPKSYKYTYKDDKDYINEDYKKNYNETYGTLKFNDTYGVSEEKKIELLFSPSPLVITDSRHYPMIRGGDDTQAKPTNSNVRILYANGIKDCINNPYNLLYDIHGGADIGTVSFHLTNYGEVSEYYRPLVTPTDSLQFYLPKKVYFPFPISWAALPTLYDLFYQNQVTELTNSNLFSMNVKMYLSDFDISNFDFRTPIFISTDIGNSYFRVLEISWKDSKTLANVKLQSLRFGPEL